MIFRVILCIGTIVYSAIFGFAESFPQFDIEKVDSIGAPITAYVHMPTPLGNRKSTLKVYVDGIEIPESAELNGQKGVALKLPSLTHPREIIIMVDVSKSMANVNWSGIRQIVENLLSSLPINWPVSLVSVGSEVNTVTPSTTDRKMVLTEMSKLTATDSHTLLYDALSTINYANEPLIVLITDGMDSGSISKSTDALRAIASERLTVYAVDATVSGNNSEKFLARVAAISGGRIMTLKETLDTLSLPQVISTHYTGNGVIALDDPSLKKPGFHELKITLIDSKNGNVIKEASQVFFSSVPRVAETGVSQQWQITLLVICLLGIVSLLFMQFRRQQNVSEFSGTKVPEMSEVPMPPTVVDVPKLRELLGLVQNLRNEADALETNIFEYGNPLELKAQQWRIACQEMARRSVLTLRSCWLMRQDNGGIDLIYNELLGNLRLLGVMEINPKIGDQIDESDNRFQVIKKTGEGPYTVTNIIVPGYEFRPRMSWKKDSSDDVILATAEVEISGDSIKIQ